MTRSLHQRSRYSHLLKSHDRSTNTTNNSLRDSNTRPTGADTTLTHTQAVEAAAIYSNNVSSTGRREGTAVIYSNTITTLLQQSANAKHPHLVIGSHCLKLLVVCNYYAETLEVFLVLLLIMRVVALLICRYSNIVNHTHTHSRMLGTEVVQCSRIP